MRFFVQGCGRYRCIEVQTAPSDVFLVEAICRRHPTLKDFPWERVVRVERSDMWKWTHVFAVAAL